MLQDVGCPLIHPCFNRLLFCFSLRLPTAGLEGDLEDAVAQGEAVEILNGHHSLFVVGHGDKPEAFALARGVVADDLDALHGAEGSEELPQDAVFSIGSQVVDEDAPPCAVEGRRGVSSVRSGGGGGGRAGQCLGD